MSCVRATLQVTLSVGLSVNPLFIPTLMKCSKMQKKLSEMDQLTLTYKLTNRLTW